MSANWKTALMTGVAILAVPALTPGSAIAQDTSSSPEGDLRRSSAGTAQAGGGEIIVTARLREESLMEVPVSVTALDSSKLEQYRATDLTDIGSLVPNVIVGDYKINGGGSLSIRGISSPATQIGFEQPVSVSIDGVQTSAGRVAMLGFFDLKSVEVMRGPQALLFGKNSPAGVISVTSAGATETLEVGGSLGYEFAGR